MQQATSILGVVGYGHEEKQEKGINRATVAEGINVHKEDGTPHDLSGVNRDPAKAKETLSKDKEVFSIAVPIVDPGKFVDNMQAISATAQDLKSNMQNFFQEAKNKVNDPVAERQIAALEEGLNQVTEILEESGIEADEQAAIIEHTWELLKEPEIAKNVALTQVVNDVMGDKTFEEASLGQMLEVSQATTKHAELTDEGMSIVKDRENPAELYQEKLLEYGVDINNVNTIHAYADKVPEELANEIKHSLAKEVDGIVKESQGQAYSKLEVLWEGYKKVDAVAGHVLDWIQIGLDGAGCSIEPTTNILADGVNALIYTLRGRSSDAGICAVGAVLPYVGDAAKPALKAGKEVFKEQLSLALKEAKSALALRNTPGKAIGGENLQVVTNEWLRGTHNNAGKVPKQIADKMRGMEFKNWDEFRRTLWKFVAEDPTLCKSFTSKDINAMKVKGTAPAAPKEQWLGKMSSYQLHHKKPIHDNGEVYDFDNIDIVTPRYHKEILEPNYHFNRYE